METKTNLYHLLNLLIKKCRHNLYMIAKNKIRNEQTYDKLIKMIDYNLNEYELNKNTKNQLTFHIIGYNESI